MDNTSSQYKPQHLYIEDFGFILPRMEPDKEKPENTDIEERGVYIIQIIEEN